MEINTRTRAMESIFLSNLMKFVVKQMNNVRFNGGLFDWLLCFVDLFTEQDF